MAADNCHQSSPASRANGTNGAAVSEAGNPLPSGNAPGAASVNNGSQAELPATQNAATPEPAANNSGSPIIATDPPTAAWNSGFPQNGASWNPAYSNAPWGYGPPPSAGQPIYYPYYPGPIVPPLDQSQVGWIGYEVPSQPYSRFQLSTGGSYYNPHMNGPYGFQSSGQPRHPSSNAPRRNFNGSGFHQSQRQSGQPRRPSSSSSHIDPNAPPFVPQSERQKSTSTGTDPLGDGSPDQPSLNNEAGSSALPGTSSSSATVPEAGSAAVDTTVASNLDAVEGTTILSTKPHNAAASKSDASLATATALDTDNEEDSVEFYGMLKYGSIMVNPRVTRMTFHSKTIEMLMASREVVTIPRESEIFTDALGRCEAAGRIVLVYTSKHGSSFATDGTLWASFFKNCFEVNITGSPSALDLSTLIPYVQGESLYLDLITSGDITSRAIAAWIPSVVTDFRFDARYTRESRFIDNITGLYSEIVLKENPRRQLAGLAPIVFQRFVLVVSDFAIGDCLPYACQRIKKMVTLPRSDILILTEQRGDNKIADQLTLLGFRFSHSGLFPDSKNAQQSYDYWKDDQEKYIMFGFRSIICSNNC